MPHIDILLLWNKLAKFCICAQTAEKKCFYLALLVNMELLHLARF